MTSSHKSTFQELTRLQGVQAVHSTHQHDLSATLDGRLLALGQSNGDICIYARNEEDKYEQTELIRG